MYRHHPAADSNSDGKLTEQEAMAFVSAASGRGGNRGPAAGFPEILDIYDGRTFQGMDYRLAPPIDIETGKRYPLILSLHGAGGIGDDNRSQFRSWNGPMARPAWRRSYPAFVLVPQAKPGAFWGERTRGRGLNNVYVRNLLPVIFELIDELVDRFPIDESRIYALGASMGGAGTWETIAARPDLFAAAIPVCPGGRPLADVSSLVDLPIWAFHGDQDQTTPVANSRTMFQLLQAAGGNLKYTELRGIPHSSWIQAFSYRGDDAERGFLTKYSSESVDRTDDVWDWLFGQQRSSAGRPAE